MTLGVQYFGGGHERGAPVLGGLASQLIGLVEARLLDPLEILLESRSDLSRVRGRVVERAGAAA